MATLNTLRTRGGVIVSIVIGLALVAFLLGDLTSSGGNLLQNRKMRVGEIDGETIGYLEYSNMVDYFTDIEQQMSGKDALNAQEQDKVKEMAWNYTISKYAYEPGYEKMGLAVSEAEQVDMVSGNYISPIINSIFANPNTGTFDASLLRNFVANINQDPSGNANKIWNYLKTQMTMQRTIGKYMNLVAKGMYVTNVEVEQNMALSNSISSAAYIMEDYAQIADSTINVTDSEIRTYYKEHKAMFRQTPSRDVEYVVFDVLPSQEDYAAAEKYIGEMAQEFAANETPFQYATLNSQVPVNKNYVGEKQLEPALAAFAFGPQSGEMYGPVLNGNNYVMARVADTKMLPDSIGARHILLSAEQKTVADSLVTALKGGASFAALAQEYSVDQNANARGGDLGIFAPAQMIPEFSDAAVKANKGEIFTVETPYGVHVVELTYKSPLSKKVQLATITYQIEPSDFTQQSIYGNASKFVASATGSYENFKKAATESALSKRVARIRNTDRNASGLEESRELVRWAFNAEKDAVSSIMEVGGDYVVAALSGINDDEYAPVEKVSTDIATLLRKEKKGVMLAEKMQGTSLTNVASKLGAEIKEVAGVEFNSFYLDGLGVEPKLIGAITAVPVDQLSKPVSASSGVFLFTVNNRQSVDNSTFESERVRLITGAQSYIGERTNQALLELSNVKDNRVKFF